MFTTETVPNPRKNQQILKYFVINRMIVFTSKYTNNSIIYDGQLISYYFLLIKLYINHDIVNFSY